MVLTAQTPNKLPEIAEAIINYAGNQKIFLFYGDMGAGKTTLIKSICQYLGVADIVTSPTFSIVNEYKGNNNNRVFHFDFYRLKSPTEALDMGYEEYFFSGDYCFIEWPEKIPSLLPPNFIKISIQVLADNLRQISFDHI